MLAPLLREMVAAEEPILEAHGLTMWGYVVLLALDRSSMRTQAALAAAIGADKTRIIRTLDELQDDGLHRAPARSGRPQGAAAGHHRSRPSASKMQSRPRSSEGRSGGSANSAPRSDGSSCGCSQRSDPTRMGMTRMERLNIMSKPAERVVFSGVQPTSDSLHLGNALGAVQAVGGPAGRVRRLLLRRRPARDHDPAGSGHAAPPHPRDRRAVPGDGHRPVPGHHLRAEPRARPRRTRLGAGLFHRFRAGVADDAVQGQVAEGGQRRHHRRPVHLSGADGRRRAALRHQPGARR